MNAREMSSILTITGSIASFGTQMVVYLHIYVASVVKCLVIVILYVPASQFHSQNQFLRSGNETNAPNNTPIESLIRTLLMTAGVYILVGQSSAQEKKSYIDLVGNELYN